jgi:RNA polymerase sigma-70 factor (sigma-E family)
MRRDDDEDWRQYSEYFAARHQAVRRTAYLMCGDWHWADDLAQTTFVQLASAWHTIRDRQALDAFARTCLIRAYLADARRVWRRRERSFAEPPDLPGLDDGTETATRRLVFARALRQLPPRQRVTLICRYYQGLDVAETAVALGCSEGTVKSQTARGLASLRRVLGDAADPPPALLCVTGEAGND